MPSQFSGSCHCGRIAVQFTTDREPADFAPRACQCSFCRRHNAAAISDPCGMLTLHLPEDHVPYRFGLEITDFHVCVRCGVYIAASWHDGPLLLGVVNLPVLDDRDRFRAAGPVSYEGEDIAARQARRRTIWTPARIATGKSGASHMWTAPAYKS